MPRGIPIKCIEHDSCPGQPKEGWFWICKECFNEMDSYAWVAKNIEKEIQKNGTITNEKIAELFKISFGVKQKFDNLRQVTKQAQEGQVK